MTMCMTSYRTSVTGILGSCGPGPTPAKMDEPGSTRDNRCHV